jgi:uncharacterized protein YbaA (DUF1428 family)
VSYVQGFVVPVPHDKKEAYRAMAEAAAEVFRDFGALSIMEAWGEDVPDGKVTDFRRAVAAEEGENVVFSWIEWPDRATCDAAAKRMESDERMQAMTDTPFDMKRMIFGGFVPIFEMRRQGG